MVILPIYKDTSSRYEYKIEIAGIVYRISHSWNVRDAAWYMDLADTVGNVIISGIRIVPSILLTHLYRYNPLHPPGEFLVIDTEENPASGGITFDNFGGRFKLSFIPDTDLV